MRRRGVRECLGSESDLEVLGTKGQNRNSSNSTVRCLLLSSKHRHSKHFLGWETNTYSAFVLFSVGGEHQARLCSSLGQMNQWMGCCRHQICPNTATGAVPQRVRDQQCTLTPCICPYVRERLLGFVLFFKTRSHVTQADLKLHMKPRMTLNS